MDAVQGQEGGVVVVQQAAQSAAVGERHCEVLHLGQWMHVFFIYSLFLCSLDELPDSHSLTPPSSSLPPISC